MVLCIVHAGSEVGVGTHANLDKTGGPALLALFGLNALTKGWSEKVSCCQQYEIKAMWHSVKVFISSHLD